MKKVNTLNQGTPSLLTFHPKKKHGLFIRRSRFRLNVLRKSQNQCLQPANTASTSTSSWQQPVKPTASVGTDKPKLLQKNARNKISVPGVFDDSDKEPLNEIKNSTDALKDIFLGDITASSAFKQFAIGGVVGWISGYLAKMVGKMAAISVGSVLFLIQMAQYHGYIQVDWLKVSHDLTKQDANVKCNIMEHQRSWISQVKAFCGENFFMNIGFATGLGITAAVTGLFRDAMSLYF